MLDFEKLQSAIKALEKSSIIIKLLEGKASVITVLGPTYAQTEITLENVDGTAECVLLKAISKAFEEYSVVSLRKLKEELRKQLRPFEE